MTLQRRIYNALIWLHPASFRRQFGREMSLDFEDALAAYGFTRLFLDATCSLARQWTACALNASEPAPQFAHAGHPFLAGHYIAADRGRLSFFDWAGATVLSTLLIFTIAFAAGVPNPHALAYLQVVRVNHDGGIDSTPPASAEVPGQHERPGTVPIPAPSGFSGKLPAAGRVHLNPYYSRMAPIPGPRARGGPRVRPITLAEAAAQLSLISAIVWITSFLLRRSPGAGRRAAIATLGLLSIAASVAFGQAPMAPNDLTVRRMFHASGPLAAYEVATIKKADPNAASRPMGPDGGPPGGWTIKNYILSAYGVSTLSQAQVVGGPAWISTDRYVIEGKVPDDLHAAIEKMTTEERGHQQMMMMESLLADRFKLKAHFETRELPVFELMAAKGGLKVKEVPPPPPFVPPTGQPAVGGVIPPPPPPPPPGPGGGAAPELRPGGVRMQRKPGGVTTLDARATTVRTLINLLRNAPEVGGKPILDETGYTANFDVVDMEWTSLGAAQAADAAGDLGAPSLFTALEEKLGLKLVPTKGPSEVLVIDSIEKPSEN